MRVEGREGEFRVSGEGGREVTSHASAVSTRTNSSTHPHAHARTRAHVRAHARTRTRTHISDSTPIKRSLLTLYIDKSLWVKLPNARGHRPC